MSPEIKKKYIYITGELWQTGWQAFNRTDKNTSHPVFGTFRLTLTLTGQGRDPWVSAEHIVVSPAASAVTVKWYKSKKSSCICYCLWGKFGKTFTAGLIYSEQAEQGPWEHPGEKRKEKENSIQSKAKKKSKRNPERTPLLCSCWGWLQFVSIGCICWDIHSHKVCKRWVV